VQDVLAANEERRPGGDRPGGLIGRALLSRAQVHPTDLFES